LAKKEKLNNKYSPHLRLNKKAKSIRELITKTPPPINKSGGKTDWYWCSNEDGSVSYIHYLAPEDRPKIPYKPPSLLQKIKNYFMKK
jgi:hypothetical protein